MAGPFLRAVVIYSILNKNKNGGFLAAIFPAISEQAFTGISENSLPMEPMTDTK